MTRRVFAASSGSAFSADEHDQGDRIPGFGVIGGQRPATKEVVLPGRWTACGIDLV
jgi:hypothetical protein